MKVLDWTSDSGVNYSNVVDSIKSLTTKYAAASPDVVPEPIHTTYVAMDTDDGRYTVFTDRGGYAWLAMPHKPTAAPTYLIITTSVNRFVDKVYNEDKGIRLTATVI
jgi:hypothetical protein